MWYGGAMLVACLLVCCGMQLWNRDLTAPFYYDLDAMLYLPLTRTIVEKGFWNPWYTDRLGAPYSQDLRDFPIIDFAHFFFMWLWGRVFSDFLLVYNAYSLMNYPLTVLTAMWVLRWLNLSLPAAAVGGLLYAFLPYHQERYHYHYFLAAYWWVPVSLVPALALLKGDFPYFRRLANGEYPAVVMDWPRIRMVAVGAIRFEQAAWRELLQSLQRAVVWLGQKVRTREAAIPIAFGFMTASTGAYYAFFACAGYAFAGVYAWIAHRTWRGAVSAALVIAPVVVVGTAYHLPTYFYHYHYGKHTITQRQPHEADHYGLKIAHLLLPANDHNIRFFAKIREQFSHPLRPSEGESAGSLGLIGGAGLVGLVSICLFPVARRWPLGPISALALYFILLGSIGALGSLFNHLIMPNVRAYNRISIFIAFLAIFTAVRWMDQFLRSQTSRWGQRLRYPALVAILIVGYFDQTPWGWNPFNAKAMAEIDKFAQRYRDDKAFFQRIEETMPAGTRVFCLPYAGYPEWGSMNGVSSYEHARGYVMTDTLYWNYGGIRNREADEWYKDVVVCPPERMLKRIVARGFDGLFIDGRGFVPGPHGENRAAVLIARLNEAYQAEAAPIPPHKPPLLPQLQHDSQTQFFLDLRPFREAWQTAHPAEYAAMEVAEREWVTPLWLAGFDYYAPPMVPEREIWGTPDATMWLVNPTDRTRTFQIAFTIYIDTPGPFGFRLSGLMDDEFTLERTDPHVPLARYDVQEIIHIPPGHSPVRIRCIPPDHLYARSTTLCYLIKDFRLVEQQ